MFRHALERLRSGITAWSAAMASVIAAWLALDDADRAATPSERDFIEQLAALGGGPVLDAHAPALTLGQALDAMYDASGDAFVLGLALSEPDPLAPPVSAAWPFDLPSLAVPAPADAAPADDFVLTAGEFSAELDYILTPSTEPASDDHWLM